MMRMEQLIKLSKTTLSACLVAGVLSAGMAQAGVSQAPLNLVEGVSPNVILTLDESGSMAQGYIPDMTAQPYKDLIGSNNNKRYHANNTNPLAYNPHLVYEIPPAFELNGDSKELTTSFSSAPANGFGVQYSTYYNPRINLATDYRPIYAHYIPFWGPDYSRPPFSYCSVSISNDDRPGTCKIGDTTVSVRRVRSGCDSVNPSSITLNIEGKTLQHNLSCSRIGSTVTITSRGNFPAFYYEFDGQLDNGKCAAKKNNYDGGGENCYRLRWVDASSAYDKDGVRLRKADNTIVDGQQNFAIWYSFYRSRALATLSAASIAFYDLSSNIRFTWQDLESCTNFTGTESGSGKCYANSLKPFNAKHRGEFYSWLRALQFGPSTPLPAAMKRAGEYLKTDTPWKMNPQGGDIGKEGSGNTKENTLACRPSYHVLMTDGIWTKTTTEPGSFRADDTTFTTPSSAKYSAMNYNKVKPFYDSKSDTLADFAMHYWATDLRPDLDNKVPTFVPFKHNSMADEYWDPRNNPAGWQHMTNFVMGLGLTTSLDKTDIPWAGSTHAGAGYKALVDGTATWPPAASNSQNNVYDLWHAAVNSRGDFYSVDSPSDMVKAFKDILSRIAERQSTATLPAIASSVEEADPDNPESVAKLASYFYRSSFDSKDWSGDLEKIKSYISYAYEGNKRKRTEVTETVWKASNFLPLHGARKIYMASSTASNKLKEFNTTNADTALKNALNKKPDEGTSDGNWEKRLDFIRGARSEEGGLFRERSSVLGDFLGSQPVYVAGARYLEGFANKIEGNTKYSEFVKHQKSRRAQIYIGGNAGMLHAFDAATGVEEFAFVPTAVFPHLNRLTDPRYAETHRFFVDGTPEVADVYDGQNWRTILVGTLRAGGQGIFALDITDPDKIKLLWELDQNSAVFIDKVKPGHSFPRPTIARLHNGRWAVVTGNGYDNGDDSGKAALYIIDAITGELTKSLEVQSPGSATHNGLSTPKLADFDGDGVADYAYAGDLHGNLWRFDLLGANAKEDRKKTEGSIYGDKVGNTTGFKVSYGAEPMFTAESSNNRAQTIMAPPSLVRHPNRQSYLIVFGTGKYYEEGDAGGDLSTAQSIYAIWDEKTKAQTTSALSISRTDDLLEQSFIENVVGKNAVAGVNREARTLSDKKMDWESKKGWVLDLKVGESALTGEMLINDMRVVGTTLLFSTLVPNDDPCAHGAGNWLYAINPFTGGRTVRHVFDTRNADPDNKVQVVSGIKFGGPGGVPLHSTPGGLEVYPGEGVNIAEMTGRQTWRVVPEP